MGEPARLAAAVSWLFVPASRPERFEKAMASGADAVVIDLEDAVPPADKPLAREKLTAHWPRPESGSGPELVVRVNDLRSAESAEDLAACRELAPTAVVLPKTESADDVRAAAEASGRSVLALVETARGLIGLPDIAAADETVRLLFGNIDLALDLGVTADAALDAARSDLVRWSAASGLPQPVDGVTTAISDPAAVTRAAETALAWGFGGKLCIHPSQLPLVAAAFAPTEEELAWAGRILDAVDGEDTGAVLVDGEMVDRPVVERARRIVACTRPAR